MCYIEVHLFACIYYLFCLALLFELRFVAQPGLAWNRWFSCLSLLSSGITGLSYHCSIAVKRQHGQGNSYKIKYFIVGLFTIWEVSPLSQWWEDGGGMAALIVLKQSYILIHRQADTGPSAGFWNHKTHLQRHTSKATTPNLSQTAPLPND